MYHNPIVDLFYTAEVSSRIMVFCSKTFLLRNLCLVNHDFYKMVNQFGITSVEWRGIELNPCKRDSESEEEFLPENVLRKRFLQFPNLKHISLSFIDCVDDKLLYDCIFGNPFCGVEFILIQCCRNVRNIHFSKEFSEGNKLRRLELLQCKNLKSLVLPQNAELKFLEFLNVHGCSNLSPVSLEKFVEKSIILHELQAGMMGPHVKQLTVVGKLLQRFSAPRSEALEVVYFVPGTNLIELDLSNTAITNQTIQHIVLKQDANVKLSSLQTLICKGCRKLNHIALQNMPELKEVVLDKCSKLEKPVFINCPKLTQISLCMTKVNDAAVEHLLSHSPKVKKLNGSKCDYLKQVVLPIAFMESLPSSNIYAPTLEDLNLSYCKDLHSVSIRVNQNTGDYFAPKEHREMKSPLKSINLNWTNVNDTAVQNCVKYCPDLEVLSLSGTTVSNLELTHCEKLAVLDLSSCKELKSPKAKTTQSKLVVKTDNCDSLEQVIVEYVPLIPSSSTSASSSSPLLMDMTKERTAIEEQPSLPKAARRLVF